MEKINNTKLIKFPTFTDERGTVSIAEASKTVPFKIERTFHTYDVPEGSLRGKHAHKQNEQVYACLKGRVAVTLDDGFNKSEIVLENPQEAIYVGPFVWCTIKFLEPGTVFIVWNSRCYEEEDYIKNYEEFLKIAKNR